MAEYILMAHSQCKMTPQLNTHDTRCLIDLVILLSTDSSTIQDGYHFANPKWHPRIPYCRDISCTRGFPEVRFTRVQMSTASIDFDIASILVNLTSGL
jgi:hypothetical protein